MRTVFLLRLWLHFSLGLLCIALQAARVKDITQIQGIRQNQLQGVGLVVGLSGDGDQDLNMTNQALQNLIREYGLNISLQDIESENVALVMLTASIDAFAKEGDRIDVVVSAMGDAESLQGGVLTQAPLFGANGQVYAVAQGPVAVGGFIGGDQGGATVQKNHPTAGIISGGAIVERRISTPIVNEPTIDLKLFNPDFTTAVRIADAINRVFPATSQALDAKTVNVIVPPTFRGQTPNFIAAIGGIDAEPDVPARIVINERTGTIIATESVSISPVAISYGALTIKVSNQPQVSQPNAFGEGQTVIANQQQTEVEEQQGKFAIVPDPALERPTIRDLTDALNKLGVTTRDMIAIFQTLKQSGALHADLEIN